MDPLTSILAPPPRFMPLIPPRPNLFFTWLYINLYYQQSLRNTGRENCVIFVTVLAFFALSVVSQFSAEMEVEIDDSFKKPGAVPFKWEIRPGVPKIQRQQKQQKKELSPPTLPSPSLPFNHRRPSPTPQVQKQKLKPPPARSVFLPPPEPRAHSFRSVPRSRSGRWRFEQPTHVRPECVSPGCFPSPLLRRKDSKRRTSAGIAKPASEPDYTSDLDTLSRWSISSRKSFSSFRDSPASSFSSYQSSPRPVSDAQWAGFGLFWRNIYMLSLRNVYQVDKFWLLYSYVPVVCHMCCHFVGSTAQDDLWIFIVLLPWSFGALFSKSTIEVHVEIKARSKISVNVVM